MADLQIVVAGQYVDTAAHVLSRILTEDEPGAAVSRTTLSALPESTRKVIDPLSLAGVIPAIPGAILAVMDITDRIRKRRKAQALIDQAKRLQTEKRVQTSLITAEGTPRALDQLTADELLALAERLTTAR